MKILISNDDGYRSEGIAALVRTVQRRADVRVVAPDRNRSGASNSLTLENPLRVQQINEFTWCVNGTPSDCVHLALTGMFDDAPDMVISGINHGANLGDDTIYSGTVAAAMEGRFLGWPAIAVSLTGHNPQNFDAAATVVDRLLNRLEGDPLPADTILNVNVPDLPIGAIHGFAATRLGFRHRSEPVQRSADPKGREVFWIGAAGDGADAGPGTDFHAIDTGVVSVTPLKTDLTHHGQLDRVNGWLGEN
ncbi:MAG: 5'/3'-nucleotidase SurE [Pseudomonadota bacterium]